VTLLLINQFPPGNEFLGSSPGLKSFWGAASGKLNFIETTLKLRTLAT
jgi:hypothetical protein